jgi:hypothetical protein
VVELLQGAREAGKQRHADPRAGVVTLKTKIFRGLEKAIADGRLTEDEVKILRDREALLQDLRRMLQKFKVEKQQAIREAFARGWDEGERSNAHFAREARAHQSRLRETIINRCVVQAMSEEKVYKATRGRAYRERIHPRVQELLNLHLPVKDVEDRFQISDWKIGEVIKRLDGRPWKPRSRKRATPETE